jgi:Icc-related predicted phosphoesterase
MRIVCLSDTHNLHDELSVPEGDLLLHAGDATMRGTEREIAAFDEWLGSLPHRDKVVIAGNHDFLFQTDPPKARRLLKNAVYLEDSGVTVSGHTIWGSPWQPWFMDWAFNLSRGAELKAVWDRIPAETSILLTHGPPHGVLDRVDRLVGRVVGAATGQGRHVGCEELLRAVERVRPRFHFFGHIHESYGREERNGTTFLNAASCDAGYRAANPAVVVDV